MVKDKKNKVLFRGVTMQKKVQINNKSVETAGVTKDYKLAISEYIWNSFDAKASEIYINCKENQFGGLEILEIVDNGEGIDYENLDNTFGSFLYSEKSNRIQGSSYIHGNKGKGRYSFIVFANTAVWETVYNSDNKSYKYSITINSYSKDFYDASPKQELSSKTVTGTKVTFSDFNTLSKAAIDCSDFKDFLLNTFAWFLYLNSDKNYRIVINSEELNYKLLIDDSLSEHNNIVVEGHNFDIHFIKWKNKIREKFFYYFLNSEKHEKHKRLTSFNNNAIDFFHSVYIVSDYFNDFYYMEIEENQLTIIQHKNEQDEAFKQLIKKLNALIEKKRKQFVKGDAPRIIEKLDEEGTFPKFGENKYEQERKRDLVEVVQEILCVQPKIFIGLNGEQKKSILGFLNLLLNTDERENIITIIDNVVQLTAEERSDLSNVLKKTSLTNIVRTMKMIESRYKVIELLRKLVFDLKQFTTERKHIQTVIEENYWLFGEQYHLVSADVNFEKALSEYLHIIDKSNDKEIYRIENQERLRRPDVFICRKRNVEYFDGTELEENIIVELKEPKVELNKEVYRQIEDYMDVISNEPKFNSQLRKWKFIIVSSKVDKFIEGLYKSFADKGKRFLVHERDKFEIYALSWDDVFKNFEIRHKYIYEKLDFDKSAIEEELELKGIKFNRESSDKIRDKILNLKAN